jgi:molecular chaperone DnaK
MVKDAESNAEADQARRENVEAKNQAEAMIHQTEKQLAEHGDKIEASEKDAIDAALQALRDAVQGEDTETIKAKTQELVQVSLKLGEAIYKQEDSGAADEDMAQQTSSSTNKQDDDIVDADFEEVKDNDKK